ncbi:conjugal transfer protein TraY [Salmonella enterica]|nr:conjugal transfer protein TraY [Salmonella enterica]
MTTLSTHVTIQLDPELNQYIEAEAKKECRSKRKQLLFMLIAQMNASLQKKEGDKK